MATLAPSHRSAAPVATAPATDDGLFAELLAAHDRQLRSFALRLVNDPTFVDDALQEAYLRAFRALPAFRGEASVRSWLYRIVHNVCMDELRRQRRSETTYDEHSMDTASADTSEISVDSADLAAGLAELPQSQRAAVLLVDGYGMDYAAAGHMLGVPAGTVGSRAFRARAALRETLAVAG